jgi:hypothetical protein
MKLTAVAERTWNATSKAAKRGPIPEHSHNQIARNELRETTAREFKMAILFSRGENAANHRRPFPALWFLTHLEIRAKSEWMADTPDLIGTEPQSDILHNAPQKQSGFAQH